MAEEIDPRIDIPALRARGRANFEREAKEFFAKPESEKFHSLVLGVAQYWADEANDAVHTLSVAFPSKDPWWPHRCDWDENDGPADGSRCGSCAYELGLPSAGLDDNSDAIYAWAAFCAEYGGGEGESENHEPLMIARRDGQGGVSFEWVGQLSRPWLDFPHAFNEREDWHEDVKGKPDPAPIPWTEAEQSQIEKVYQAPDDDAPRKVMIDAWLEAEDPRGTFGALSFSEALSDEDRQTRDRLIDEHGRRWLGPLAAVVPLSGTTFSRGPFAERVTAHFADQKAFKAHSLHREWATVRSIRFASGGSPACSAAMTGLREVFGVNVAVLKSLKDATAPWAIETLGFSGEEDLERLIELWRASKTLPRVSRLIVEQVANPKQLEALLSVPQAAKLTALEVLMTDDPPRGWADGRAASLLRLLDEKARPGVALRFGYGAQHGLVAQKNAGDPNAVLELRGLTEPNQVKAAVQQLEAARFHLRPMTESLIQLSERAGEPAASAVPEAPRVFQRFTETPETSFAAVLTPPGGVAAAPPVPRPLPPAPKKLPLAVVFGIVGVISILIRLIMRAL